MSSSAGGSAAGVAGSWERARSGLRALDLLPPPGHLLAWTAAVGVTSYLLRWLATLDGRTFTVAWLAAAFQLVALLTARRRHWPVYLVAFALCQYLPAWLLLGHRPDLAALSTFAAVLLAASVLHTDQDWVRGHTDSLQSWRRFVLYGVVLGPLLAAAIGAASLVVSHQGPVDGRSLLMAGLMWYLTEAVGIAFLAPVLLRWRRYFRRYSARQLVTGLGFSLLMVALGVLAVVESSFVLMFLTGLPALLVLIEFGIAAAFWQMAVGATIVLGATLMHAGPFAAADNFTMGMVHAQVFLLAGYAMVVLVAAALEERNRLTELDHASHEVYDLVADLTGDLVIVVDARGDVLHHAFTGHSNLNLSGDRITRAQWEAEVHADDLRIIAEHWTSRRTGPSQPFRMRSRDGSWCWFVMHSRRSTRGLSAAVLRDVTLEREVQESLTDMAHTDALTGLANRRGLSQRTREVWLRALEADQPLTALFIDVDHFKAYNDHFGHQTGDGCLQEIAAVLQNLADPAACVSARYGGEEFAVVLTGCDSPYTFAAGLASAIRALGIGHPGSPCGVVTVSIGVATVVPRDEVRRPGVAPDPDDAVARLLDRADRALYSAKAGGRNAIAVAPDERMSLGQQVHRPGERVREAAGSRNDE
ncbi:diguanylate cyclase [Mycobacterium sp. SMC-4]|uniref:sensor domain-containing diguanylate cyclase n=1 Tax=Mycobacterium sp. SMC-4 TaxID=2857059 RepID=UPI0021B22D0F|nr:diguanylate cyclase [Mycobacterium sp. SMC-4]UXA18847.1 diguanylate cyclase [Mycobacterium sp. SMC-4]